MSTVNDLSSIQAIVTDRYADTLKDLVDAGSTYQKHIPFRTADRLGDDYVQPVVLGMENGVIFNADGSGFSITDPGPQAATFKRALVSGYETLVATDISYKAITAELGGEKSYATADLYVKLNSKAMAWAQDTSILHGQMGIAETTAVSASGTTGSFVVSEATFQPGYWSRAIGMALDLFAAVGDAAPINTNSYVRVTGVVNSTRTVSFTCNASDASALNSASVSTVFRRRANAGSGSFREPAGLRKIISNTGTLFNIDAGTYPLWKGITKDVGSKNLTMAAIQSAVAESVAHTLDDDLLMFVSPQTWGTVMTDLAALRIAEGADVGRRKFENGATGIQFWGPNGSITFIHDIKMYPSQAVAFPAGVMHRVGSTEPTFKLPGVEAMVLHLESSAVHQIRSYADQALFCEEPASCILFTNISNA